MIYRTLLILAVIIASMPLALAEGESISLGSYSVAPGSTVDVPITIGNANLVAGGVVKITYDSTIVNVASVSSGDFGVPVANTNIVGVVTLSAAGTTAIGTSSAVLGVIKFEGVSSGTSTLAFQAYPNSYLSLENGSLVNASLSDGAITVSGAGAVTDMVGVYDNAGTWALWNSGSGAADIVGFGWPDTEPVVGDWDGDGITEVGIYNTAGNNFLLQTDAGFDVIGLGWAGVTPVVGDWNGDGADDVGVYDNAGTWALWNTGTSSADIVGFGWGTEPIVGDWDGDGVTEVGIYNTGGSNFFIQTDSGANVIGLGWAGVSPVVGDWNGDGADDVGVYDNAGTWALWNTGTSSADIVGFGWPGTEPVVGDWDGDGVTEVGIYNTGGSNFFIQTDSGADVIGLGWAGVTPVIGDWS